MFLPSTMTLAPGDSGEFVAELQRRLGSLHLYPSEAISGVYDGMTTNSVTSFQQQQGLRSDGIAGPETLRRLNGVISGTYNETLEKQQAAADPLAVERYAQVHLAGQDEAFSFTQPAAEVSPAFAEGRPVESAAQMREAAAMNILQQATTLQPVAADFMPSAHASAPLTPALQPEPMPQQPAAATHAMTTPQATAIPAVDEKQPLPISPENTAQPRPAVPDQAPYHNPENPWMAKPQPPVTPVAAEAKPETPVQAVPVYAAAPVPALATSPALAEPVKTPTMQPNTRDMAPEIKAPSAPPAAAATLPAQALTASEPQAMPRAEAMSEKPAQAPTLRERISGLVARIAEYMEAKLPPSVLSEVQQIGASMHARGIKEIPLPAGDTALPSPSVTPARGAAAAPERAG